MGQADGEIATGRRVAGGRNAVARGGLRSARPLRPGLGLAVCPAPRRTPRGALEHRRLVEPAPALGTALLLATAGAPAPQRACRPARRYGRPTRRRPTRRSPGRHRGPGRHVCGAARSGFGVGADGESRVGTHLVHGPTNVPLTPSVNEVFTLTVRGSSGKYSLTFENGETEEFGTTKLIPFDASAQEVQEALEKLKEGEHKAIGEGNVKVTGGPGDEHGTKPYVIEFVGAARGTGPGSEALGIEGSDTSEARRRTCEAEGDRKANANLEERQLRSLPGRATPSTTS